MSHTYKLCCQGQHTILSITIPVPLLEHDLQTCECSRCSKTGVIWGSVENDQVKVLKGEGGDWAGLKGYRFGEESMEHLFCPIDGTYLLFHRTSKDKTGKTSIRFNARAIPSMIPELHTFTPGVFPTGLTRPPHFPPPTPLSSVHHPFTLPSPTNSTDADNEGQQGLYFGSCHCAKVEFAVQTKCLREREDGCDCNCSICFMNGVLWIYPLLSTIHFSPTSHSSISSWSFSSKPLPERNIFYFCSTCGCTIYEHRQSSEGCGLNARLLDFVDDKDKGKGVLWDSESVGLKMKKDDSWSWEPRYVLP